MACEPVMVVPFTTPTLGNVQAIENLVEQRRVAAGFGGVESVQDSVLEDIVFVDVGAAQKLGAFAAHVADVEHQPRPDFAAERSVPVLDVRLLQCRCPRPRWSAWLELVSLIGTVASGGRPVGELAGSAVARF